MGRRRAGSREKRRRTSSRVWRAASSPSSRRGRGVGDRTHPRPSSPRGRRARDHQASPPNHLLADADEDGQVSLPELAGLFCRVPRRRDVPAAAPGTRGSLQLLPPSESAAATSAADRSRRGTLACPETIIHCERSSVTVSPSSASAGPRTRRHTVPSSEFASTLDYPWRRWRRVRVPDARPPRPHGSYPCSPERRVYVPEL